MYFCRECSCFVKSPLATCRACGCEHSNYMGRATEQPVAKRRPSARTIPRRPIRR